MISFLLLIFTMLNNAPTATLNVEIEGIRNDKGHILLAIYESKTGFPNDPQKAIARKRIPAKAGKMTITVEGLAYKKYAFGIIHDENDNQKLDTGLFGIPKEGFCFSRQAMGTLGPPDYDKAAFDFKAGIETQKVKVSYW